MSKYRRWQTDIDEYIHLELAFPGPKFSSYGPYDPSKHFEPLYSKVTIAHPMFYEVMFRLYAKRKNFRYRGDSTPYLRFRRELDRMIAAGPDAPYEARQ